VIYPKTDNLIVIEKWLEQNARGYQECRNTKDGDLVLLTKDKNQAEKLCKIVLMQTGPERFIDIKIELMENLNNSKGTMYSRELLNIPIDGTEGLMAYLA
jgi:hypothetical protein